MEELLAGRLWIPWARFERLDDSTAVASKKNENLPTEPTYQFKVGVVVKGKDSETATMAFVTEKFQKPLEAALKSEGLDLKPAGKGGDLVQKAPEINDNLAEIFYSPSGKSAGLEEGQEGRPFHKRIQRFATCARAVWCFPTSPFYFGLFSLGRQTYN